MPVKKGTAIASLSGLIDSDGDVDMVPSPDSNQENEPAAKSKKTASMTSSKPRGRPPGKAVANTKAKTSRKEAGGNRAPLREHGHASDGGHGSETDDIGGGASTVGLRVDPASDSDAPPKKQPARRGRPPAKVKQEPPAKATASAKLRTLQKDGEFEYTPTRSQLAKAVPKPKPGSKSGEVAADLEEENVDEHTMLSIEEDDVVEPSNYKTTQPIRKPPAPAANTHHNPRKRAGSLSEPERSGDVVLRRKLGEMTRKFESLESRYKNLKDIGIAEAELNFDRLRRQSEQRTKAANDLIESLRNEIESYRAANQDISQQVNELRSAKRDLAESISRANELNAALNRARRETEALQAKLAAAKTAPISASQRGPMSASKPGVATNAEASHSLQTAQLKEDLYSDLTGLIIRSVSKLGQGAVYDCIQTGCNGTLHFKLSVASEESAAAFEDTEFQYEPRLDKDRDQDLIDIMPDYLSDEISFSRANAAKFYSRIADTLTKRLVD